MKLIGMGQPASSPRSVLQVKDFVVGTCFKNIVAGEGPYNYCYKVTKIVKKRNGDYTIYTVNPLLKSKHESYSTFRGDEEFKKCACPAKRVFGKTRRSK